MATQYIILTDDIDSGRLYTSKAAAIKEAHALGLIADKRGEGQIITVETLKTNKRVWSHTAAVEITPLPSVPEMSQVPSECFYGCENPVTGAAVDYVGTTIGVCDEHAHRVGTSEVFPLPVPSVEPVEPTGTPTVCVIQERPGLLGINHYHAPGCRDISREMGRFGQTDTDAYSASFGTLADIFAHEYGDVAGNEYESGTPEWWANVVDACRVDEYTGVKIMPCLSIPFGKAGDAPLIRVSGVFEIAPTNIECQSVTVENRCICENGCAACSPAIDADYEETMVSQDYHLSVTVDETTGATVDLGWVTLTLNAAQVDDWDAVADAYGAAHGSGTPRHGWGSIINILS